MPTSTYWLAPLNANACPTRPAAKFAPLTSVPLLLSMASIAENMAGDRVSALRSLDEATLVSGPLDDFPARISVLQARALNGFFQGDIETVKAAASEGVRISRDAGDLYSLEMMLLNRGGTALIVRELEQAKASYMEALKIAQRIDDRVAEYALLDGLGCVAAGLGQPRHAALPHSPQLTGAA